MAASSELEDIDRACIIDLMRKHRDEMEDFVVRRKLSGRVFVSLAENYGPTGLEKLTLRVKWDAESQELSRESDCF